MGMNMSMKSWIMCSESSALDPYETSQRDRELVGYMSHVLRWTLIVVVALSPDSRDGYWTLKSR